MLNNINKYNNGLINIIISGSVLLLFKQQLKVDDDISNKLFEVYETSKDLAEDISTLFSYLYSDDDNNINLEKIFKFIIENKTNEIIVNNCCKLLRNKGRIKDLFKNKEYQKDAINIINESKNIPIELIDVVDLIEEKLPELEDLIKFNKYFINIKKENNIKDKNINLNDEHLNIIFTKLIDTRTMNPIYTLLEIVPTEIIAKNFDSINKLINTNFLEEVISILVNKRIKLSQEIINIYIKKLDSDN